MSCRKKMPPIFVSEDEFQTLREAFFEKVVLGRDVFTKSTPAEIEKFETFLKKSLPYDVVIDGLNAAYSAGTRGVTPIDLVIFNENYYL
jgi:mitochondrial ribonuclease P protein 3